MARRGQVRATAEIDKIPLRIGRNGLSVGKTFNQLYLIVLASSFEKLNGLSLIELSPRNRKFAFCNLASAFFDLFKILRRKCPVISEVVIKTVFECWSNRQLCCRKKFLYGLSHDVRAAVAIDFAPLCAIKAKRLNSRVARQWSRQICCLSIDGGSKDIRAKSDTPGRERLSDALPQRHIKTLSVLQADFWHKSLSIMDTARLFLWIQLRPRPAKKEKPLISPQDTKTRKAPQPYQTVRCPRRDGRRGRS